MTLSARTALAVLVLAALAAAPAQARRPRKAEPEPAVHAPDAPLTLAAATEQALARDARVAAQRAAVNAARVAVRAAKDLRDPELRLTYGQDATEATVLGGADEDRDQYEAGLRIYAPNIWSAAAKRRAARERVLASQAGLSRAEWQATLRVKRRFAEIGYLEAKVELAERLAAVQADRRDAASARHAQGAALPDEMASAGLRKLAALGELDSAQQQLTRARGDLAALLGIEDAAALKIETLPPAGLPGRMPESAEACASALEHRADLRQLDHELAAADADLRTAKRERVPSLTYVQLSYQERYGFEDNEGWAVQGAMNLPLFSLATAGEADVRAAEVKQRRADLEAYREQVAQEVRDALAVAAAAAETVRRYESEAGPLIEELRAAAEMMKDHPSVDRESYGRLQAELLQTEAARLDARHAYDEAVRVLEEMLGTALP